MVSPRDTIVTNDTILDAFQRSKAYDYARELEPGNETNYFDRFEDYIKDLLDFDVTSIRFPQWVWWCLGAMAVIAVGYFLWKQQATLFGPKDVGLTAEEITEEDINEVDFDQLIAEAESCDDYLALCRLRYLQTLKAASDASLVAWQRYKTPTQYAMEWPDEDFGIMTNHFLRIRYGHYTADAVLAQEMHSRQEAVLARIATRNTAQQPTGIEQEGGVTP